MGVSVRHESDAFEAARPSGSGIEIQSGVIREDYLEEFSPEERKKTIERMAADPQVSGQAAFYKLPLQGAEWFIERPDDTPRSREIEEKIAATYLRQGPREYWTATSWRQRLGEILYGMIHWGWAVHYKEESFISAGALGPMEIVSRYVFLHPRTIDEWDIRNGDQWKGLFRSYVKPDGQWEEGENLPSNKLSLFTYEALGGNPEGRAKMRPLFRPYKLKDIAERMEAIDVQRRGAAMPIGKYSTDNPSDDEKTSMQQALKILSGEYPEGAWATMGPDAELGYVEMTGDVKDPADMIRAKKSDMSDALHTGFLKLGQTEFGAKAVADPQMAWAMLPLNEFAGWVKTIANEGMLGQPGDIQWYVDRNFDSVDEYPQLNCRKINPLEQRETVPLVADIMADERIIDDDPEIRWPMQAELVERAGFTVPARLKELAENPKKFAQEKRDADEEKAAREMADDIAKSIATNVDPNDPPVPPEETADLAASMRKHLLKEMDRKGMKIPDGFTVALIHAKHLEEDLEDAKKRPEGDKLIASPGGARRPGFFRDPTPFEQRFVSLSAIVKAFDDLEARLFAELMRGQNAIIDEMLDKTKSGKIHSGNVMNLNKPGGPVIAKRFSSRPELRRVFRDGLRMGREQVRNELVRQTKARRIAAARIRIPQGSDAWALTLDNSEAQIGLALDSMVSELSAFFADQMLQQAQQGVAAAGTMANRLQAPLKGLAGSAQKAQARGMATLSFNWGRNVEIQVRRESIAFVIRSEVLDVATCVPCADLDGRKYNVNSRKYWEFMPPAKCQGGRNCRGFYVVIAA